jgi:hypothetical protein
MKITIVSLIILANFATNLFADDKSDQQFRIEAMSAEGQKDISFGTMLSPPGLGAVGRAEMIAKKKLKQKCKDEFNGKIEGEIKYTTLRFDEGIMAAVVRADGNCKY